jgi:predicted HicB family RNase H-like nuclease
MATMSWVANEPKKPGRPRGRPRTVKRFTLRLSIEEYKTALERASLDGMSLNALVTSDVKRANALYNGERQGGE